MKKLILVIILLIIATTIGWHYHRRKPQPPATVSVTRGDITQKAIASGYIVPLHTITVKSPIDGIVSKLYHDSGDYVTANTSLLDLKPNPKPADLARALSSVSKDKAAVKADEIQKKGYEKLLIHGVISKNYQDYVNLLKTLNQDRATLKNDQQQLQLLKAGRATIDNQPMSSLIKSPITGYILSRYVDIGDAVIALGNYSEATALFTIANMNTLVFQGDVDESDANDLKTGMPARITIAASPNAQVTGSIARLALESEQQHALNKPAGASAGAANTSTFNVAYQIQINKLHVPENLRLRSGYSATASVNIRTIKHVLTLPERVIHFKNNQSFVQLPSKTQPNIGKKQIVTLGLSDGNKVEILSGLSVGQKVLDQTTVPTASQH